MQETTPTIHCVRGFTLIEILMAVVIIGILATVAMRSLSGTVERSRIEDTQAEMDLLVTAIAGNPDLYANGLRSDFGYVGDIGAVPSSLDNLVTNPGLGTWNGPYVTGYFSEDATGYKKDAWGNTYGFTNGITISSTGGGATAMTRSAASAAGDLTSNGVSGTVTDAAGNPPGDSSVAVTVRITYPDGAGSTTTATANPGSGGGFYFSAIPIGNHTVEAIYRATDDTVVAFASVLPKTGANLSLRLPGNSFAAGGGGGSGSGAIEYVSGSAQTTGGQNNYVQFDITNTGTADVSVSSLSASYSPAAYFQVVKWSSATVFNESSPRAGSGDTCPFSSVQSIAAGAMLTVEINIFYDQPTGGSSYDITNTDFTVTFSDGSVISFNSGP
jgi:prepilin-type N-terminal cleavage/methylation domain-containing protein